MRLVVSYEVSLTYHTAFSLVWMDLVLQFLATSLPRPNAIAIGYWHRQDKSLGRERETRNGLSTKNVSALDRRRWTAAAAPVLPIPSLPSMSGESGPYSPIRPLKKRFLGCAKSEESRNVSQFRVSRTDGFPALPASRKYD